MGVARGKGFLPGRQACPRVPTVPAPRTTQPSRPEVVLATKIQGWLDGAEPAEPGPHARAIIAPHAGYSYCGAVMAYAYRHIRPENV